MSETRRSLESRRSYDEGCIAAHALDLIGDRWALLVVRELMLGSRRFGQIRGGLPGVSAKVLTARLAELGRASLLTHDGATYALTGAGLALWPVLRALCLWGAAQPGHDPRLFISPTALMLSMRATCCRGAAGAHRVCVTMGDEAFTITTAPGHYRVERGAADGPALRFRGTANTLAIAIYGPMPLAQTAAGLIGFEGDIAEGQAFVDLFALQREG